jgi:hypothetical protein
MKISTIAAAQSAFAYSSALIAATFWSKAEMKTGSAIKMRSRVSRRITFRTPGLSIGRFGLSVAIRPGQCDLTCSTGARAVERGAADVPPECSPRPVVGQAHRISLGQA